MEAKFIMRIKRCFLVLLCLCAWTFPLYSSGLLVFAGQGAAQKTAEGEKVPHVIPKIESKIHVDGKMNEAEWENALKLELKYEFYPGENIPAPVKTEVFFLYSKTHFYIAFRAYDPKPSAIRARYTDRDNVWSDDWVAISMDTFNDQRRRFTFFSNPLGVQAEMIETINNEVIPWDTIWASAGHITDTGYIVEIGIPFSSLRFQRKKGDQVWRFETIRSYPRNVRHYMGLFPHDRNNVCVMCQAEKMKGFAGARPGKHIEFDPTLSAVLTQEREDLVNGDFEEKEKSLSPGITARWNFTPNLMLGATINPDFSNIEADAAQLDVNTQYALYYPEKRPFFLEDASIFNTRLSAVYTRSMAEPDWGIKLSGKEGKHAVGFYSVQDNITNFLFPGSMMSMNGSLDQKNISSVLRYRLDLGKASTMGVIATSREGEDYYNRLFGVDGAIRFTDSDELMFQFMTTQTRYPDQVAAGFGQPGDKFSGAAVDMFFKHTSRNVGFYSFFRQIDEDFRADLGFITQAGFRHYESGFDYSWLRNPGHWFTQIKMGPSFEYETDFDNNLLYKSFKFQTVYNGPAQSELIMTGSVGKRFFLGQYFDTDHIVINLNMYPSGKLQLALYGAIGDAIDFTNRQQGSRVLLNGAFNIKAGRHLSFTLDHIYEKFDVDAGHLYTANVSNLYLAYQFNRKMFLRTIMQYIDYEYNPDNYIMPQTPRFKRLFSQFLFSYKVNPHTVLFLGYSDNYFGFLQVPLKQANRTFFLKIGYALRL